MKEIVFKPSPKQFQAWEFLTDDQTTELGFGGGAGGGKSYLGCFWIIAMCLAYPGTRWLIGRKELVNLKRTTLKTFFKVCAEYDLQPDRDFNFNQATNTITFHNATDKTTGSEVVLFDLSSSPADPEYTRLGSLELTSAFVDESNEVEAKAIDILSKRLGRQLNKEYSLKPKLLETFNPNKDHVYFRYYKPSKSGTLPHYRRFIQSLVTDNPYVTEDYIEQLKRGDKVSVQRLFYGNFEYDDDPTVLMGYDAITDLFTNTVDLSEEKFITCDAARHGGDYVVIAVWKGLRAYKWVWFNRVGLDHTIERLRTIAAEEQIPWSHILVDEDGVGGGIIDMMKGIKGFIGNASPIPRGPEKVWNKPVRSENFRNLRAQCYFALADAVNNHKMAVNIDDLNIQERLSLELQQVKQKNPDSDQKLQIIAKDEMKESLGHSPDFADTLMMRMWFEVRFPNGRKVLVEKPKTAIEKEFFANKKRAFKPLATKL